MALKVRNQELDLDITPDTPIPNWCGETMDTDLELECGDMGRYGHAG